MHYFVHGCKTANNCPNRNDAHVDNLLHEAFPGAVQSNNLVKSPIVCLYAVTLALGTKLNRMVSFPD